MAEKCELSGKKWIVENYKGKKDLVIENPETSQSVYVYNLQDCVLQVKGKVSSICVDKCKKSGVVYPKTVASCEIVNSANLQVQGSSPSYTVDKSESVTLFLNKDDSAAEIYTSGSTVNLTVIEDPEKDPQEIPIPSQFVTKNVKGKWVTAPTDHVGV
eukprot:CAMPEP_0177653068 /NCGR_PEP_ID=MMETSP0447-20121125/13512_1 /TAXON_ID=0 /ORGANISM="Stygamoeba regulata, Strain BSH-02190019" /LENGTH=157 /DNA_ID=CAMNT_0019156447 /DNA_START=47 /DNA_END=520 /DNA_ORIENTATION=-